MQCARSCIHFLNPETNYQVASRKLEWRRVRSLIKILQCTSNKRVFMYLQYLLLEIGSFLSFNYYCRGTRTWMNIFTCKYVLDCWWRGNIIFICTSCVFIEMNGGWRYLHFKDRQRMPLCWYILDMEPESMSECVMCEEVVWCDVIQSIQFIEMRFCMNYKGTPPTPPTQWKSLF